MIKRRAFLTGLVSLLAAPAVVKAQSLMPIRGFILPHHWMTVTLDGITHYRVGGYDAFGTHIEEFIDMPVSKSVDVPWLGSQQKSMAYYNTEVKKLRPLFSEVRTISWGDTSPPGDAWQASMQAIPMNPSNPHGRSPYITAAAPMASLIEEVL